MTNVRTLHEETPREVCERGIVVTVWTGRDAEVLMAQFFPLVLA